MAINFTGNVWSLLSNAVCLPRTTPCLRWSSLRWWGQGRRRTRSGGGMQWVVVSPQYALTKQGGTGLEPCVFVRIYGWRSLGMRLYLCTMVNTWCIIIIIIMVMIVMHQAIAFVILELFGANQNKEWQSRARRKGKGSWLFHIPIYCHTLFISFHEIRFYHVFSFGHGFSWIFHSRVRIFELRPQIFHRRKTQPAGPSASLTIHCSVKVCGYIRASG